MGNGLISFGAATMRIRFTICRSNKLPYVGLRSYGLMAGVVLLSLKFLPSPAGSPCYGDGEKESASSAAKVAVASVNATSCSSVLELVSF